jgi:hypothetical protein
MWWWCYHACVVCCFPVLQQRRLAFAGYCHPRLGQNSWLMDFDVLVQIGKTVIAQSLVTRDEVSVALATEQRQRALRGEKILRGTTVWFVGDGEGVYVGGDEDPGQGGYTFEFGVTFKLGSAMACKRKRCKRMHLASMDPKQWTVRPRSDVAEKHESLKRANEASLEPQTACGDINGDAGGAEDGQNPTKRRRQ